MGLHRHIFCRHSLTLLTPPNSRYPLRAHSIWRLLLAARPAPLNAVSLKNFHQGLCKLFAWAMNDEVFMGIQHRFLKDCLPHTLSTPDTKESLELIVTCYIKIRGINAVKRAFGVVAKRIGSFHIRYTTEL